MADINDEMTFKRLQSAINASVNTLEKKKENALKVIKNNCDEKTEIVFKEELEYLFDILGELPLEIEPYQTDNRFINLINDQKVVGTVAILADSLEYYFDSTCQNVHFKIKKFLDDNGNIKYIKNIYVDGREDGKYSSERSEQELPEITKMIYEVEEILDSENSVVEQNFVLKESPRDISKFENVTLADLEGSDKSFMELAYELSATSYNATNQNGEVKAYVETSRGFSNARKVKEWASLPKAKIEYRENYLPFSILCNLEVISKRLLCSEEFKGFKVEPYIEECDDKYIYLSRVNSDTWLENSSSDSEEESEPPIILS